MAAADLLSVARQLPHLARRFAGSLRPGGPSPTDEAWAESHLGNGERLLWRRMSGADRRHAVGVARTVGEARLVPAALLHDVGKIESPLGTFGRVVATLGAAVLGRSRWQPDGAVGRYLRHDAIGAELLAAAGAAPLTVAWAREHHLPPERWSVDRADGERLKAADDD